LIGSAFGNRHSCTIQGINQNIVDLATFTKDFWLTTVKLNHASEEMGTSEISGLDSRGNNLNLSFNSTGTFTTTGGAGNVNNVIAMTFAEMTAVLQVAIGRQISIIY
jgi:hypothetical protein